MLAATVSRIHPWRALKDANFRSTFLGRLPLLSDMSRLSWCAAWVATWAVSAVLGASPWPAEPNSQALKLTSIDPEFNAVNMSGATWNPVTRTLWLANNSGQFWALVENGAGSFRVATNAAGTKAKWSPGGDLESICQADFSQPLVYLMDENGWIREYDVSQYGVVHENRNWDIRTQCPEVGGSAGPEGLTFVPDDWLRREGFQATNGLPCVSSNGMGGLMFVGHQDGGYVHVFDLNRTNNTYSYVGRYKTGEGETAGLEFDRSTGKLYIWHNTGSNYLEVTELNSYPAGAERRLRPLIEYVGPRTGNLEGFALAPGTGTNRWCFLTDDDNLNGEAILWFRQFQPVEDTDGDSLSDDWELRYFGTTTRTAGPADPDLDGMSNAAEQAAGTDPTDPGSVFTFLSAATAPDKGALVLSWRSVAGRTYEVRATPGLPGSFAQVVVTSIPATPPVNVSTVAISAAVGSAYYRVAVCAP